MDVVPDFEDLLDSFSKHDVRYVVIGGLAFIFHVKPRFTKDMDLWVEPTEKNIRLANEALADFGSPHLLDPADTNQVLQIGVQPCRVDILLHVEGPTFERVWRKRIRSRYGRSPVNWIDMDSLIEIKEKIDHPKHRLDVEYLLKVKEMRKGKKRRK